MLKFLGFLLILVGGALLAFQFFGPQLAGYTPTWLTTGLTHIDRWGTQTGQIIRYSVLAFGCLLFVMGMLMRRRNEI